MTIESGGDASEAIAAAQRLREVEQGLERLGRVDVARELQLTAAQAAEAARNLQRLRDELRTKLGMPSLSAWEPSPQSSRIGGSQKSEATGRAVEGRWHDELRAALAELRSARNNPGPLAATMPGMAVPAATAIPPLVMLASERRQAESLASPTFQPPTPGGLSQEERDREAARHEEDSRRRNTDALARLTAELKRPTPAAATLQQQSGTDARAGVTAAMSLSTGAGASAMAMAGMAGAMSSLPTFKASLEGLSIEIGSQFLPALDKMSEYLQRAEQGFSRLEPGTKQTVGRIGMLAIGAGTAATAFTALHPVLTRSAAALTALGGVVVAHPLLALAGVVTAAASAYLLLDRNAKSAADSMRDAAGAGAPGGGRGADNQITAADVNGLPAEVRKKIGDAGGDKSKVQDILKDYRDQAAKELEDLKKSSVPDVAKLDAAQKRFNELAGAAMPGMERAYEAHGVDAWYRKIGRGGSQEFNERFDAAAGVSSSAATLMEARMKKEGFDISATHIRDRLADMLLKRMYPDQYGGLAPESAIGRDADVRRNARLRGAEDRARAADELYRKSGGDDFQMRRDFRGPAPAIFSDPLEAMNRIQLAGLQAGDKTAENLQKQLVNALENKQALDSIRSKLDEIKVVIGPPFGY